MDERSLLRRLFHAELPRVECRTTGRAISGSTQKLVLAAIAGHDGERISIEQLARLCGIAHSTAAYTLSSLVDRGLVQRVESRRGEMPQSAKSPFAYAYRVQWPAVISAPMVDTDPARISTWHRRRKVVRHG